jgi:hypothetical protein
MMARRLRLAAPWLLLLPVGLMAAWLRYSLIESSAIGAVCSALIRPSWCIGREWLVLGFRENIYGAAALVATVLALLPRRPWAAWLAAALGLFALELYCFETGALALLIGCLRLLRWQALGSAPAAEQHRAGHRPVQAQP